MAFYNTINLDKKELQKALRKSEKQKDQVLAVFRTSKEPLTPAEVFTFLNGYYPIGSIRRAITDLTGYELVKTEIMREGLYGSPNYCWKLRFS